MTATRRLLDLWIDSLCTERDVSASSVSTYINDVKPYLAFLEDQGLRLLDVKTEHLRAFLVHLSERGFATSTIARRRSVLRSLHHFLVLDGHTQSDPTGDLDSIKKTRSKPVVPSEIHVDRLLETAHRFAHDASVGLYRQAGYARRAAILETLYATGMRVSEIINIPASIVDGDMSALFVKGKGNKERLVPVHAKARETIRHWRALVAAFGTASDRWLFHAVKSGANPLTRQAVFTDIKAVASDADLAPHGLSPHKLRHAFASHLLSNGVNLRTIQELLGHEDLATTQVYTHVLDERMTDMVRDLHPLGDDFAERGSIASRAQSDPSTS